MIFVPGFDVVVTFYGVWMQEGGATERELVPTLFPALGPTQAWKRNMPLGNFLNGHEPVRREIVFSSDPATI